MLSASASRPATASSSGVGPERPTRRRQKRADRPQKQTMWEKLEAFISRLSTKNNFWHRVVSLVFLPYAFKSGIKMAKRPNAQHSYILPFRRFNKNWYNAMAGAALLGNSEVAGGMYIFQKAGKDYTVVCKELHYKFLRPCFGPAVYRVLDKDEELAEFIKEGGEFNLDLTINIYQPPSKPSDVEKRVGRCKVTFHVTPKLHHRERKAAGRKTAVRGTV
ncbi:MAG: hypothetical protein ACNA8P_11705 [Phycisphaerales bacterium]